jgi:two-component system, NarL family, response regulator DevR
MIADSGSPLRLYVVESQRLFGRALCQIFAMDPGVIVVGVSHAVDAEALVRLGPDLIVLDLDSGVEVTAGLDVCRRFVPNARVCVLSMRPHVELMQSCVAAGAKGYIVKDSTPSELVRAMKMIADGETYVDHRIAGALLRRRSLTSGRVDVDELSMRETEIVRFIAQGLSNKEISARLGLSDKTIKNHISRIFSKLNIGARSQAAVHAIRIGLC